MSSPADLGAEKVAEPGRPPFREAMAPLVILHTNDFHGMAVGDRLTRLAEARKRADLYFDSGDAIRAGNLSMPLRTDPVWASLAELACTASSPGNRESHILPAAVRAKTAGATHPVLCANWHDREGHLVFAPHLTLCLRGVRIGVFGVMVPMVTPRMKTASASSYLWSPPIQAARAMVAELRSNVDFLVALTHVGLTVDRELADACPEIDLILGGHSHHVLDPPEVRGRTVIGQLGSHARYAGLYTWQVGVGLTGFEKVALA